MVLRLVLFGEVGNVVRYAWGIVSASALGVCGFLVLSSWVRSVVKDTMN